jgi:hypothetical protein
MKGKATASANGFGWQRTERALLAFCPSCTRMTILTLEEHSLALPKSSKKSGRIDRNSSPLRCFQSQLHRLVPNQLEGRDEMKW